MSFVGITLIHLEIQGESTPVNRQTNNYLRQITTMVFAVALFPKSGFFEGMLILFVSFKIQSGNIVEDNGNGLTGTLFCLLPGIIKQQRHEGIFFKRVHIVIDTLNIHNPVQIIRKIAGGTEFTFWKSNPS